MIAVNTCELRNAIPCLHAGDRVLLSGTVYTARDAAHKLLIDRINAGLELPFPLKDSVIYYTGPTPVPHGRIIGSCGPTTSARMDPFTPALYDRGVAATIGKGQRSGDVIRAIKRNFSIYFCAVAGLGAYLSSFVVSMRECAYSHLGCESVKVLTVKDFPLYVGIDADGKTIFDGGLYHDQG